MTILVTGGTGFLGSAIVRSLLADGQKNVRVLVRPRSNRYNLLGLSISEIEGDLIDISSLKRALNGVTTLFHVAADYRLWVPGQESEIMDTTNIVGSRNLLRAASEVGVNRIIYTSSVATLGLRPDGVPSDENTPVNLTDMIGSYKRSKFLAEAEVRRLVIEENVPAIIVNPSTPIGPCDIKPTPTGRLICKAASGYMPAYVDTGLNLVHVNDVANGHLLAWRFGCIGERYILGGEDITLRDILIIIALLLNRQLPLIQLAHNIMQPFALFSEILARFFKKEPFLTIDSLRMAKKKMFFSSAKAHHTLGYTPKKTAIESLQEAITWFKSEGYI